MVGKKVASICIIIIGIIVAIPFNYIYEVGEFEVDVIWTIVGIVMMASGFYLLKNSAKLKPI
jgi:ABC-type Mn2+/Zn2+ transport system permease subunit